MRQKSTKDLTHVAAYLPKELLKKIKEKADKDRRSVSSEVVVLLEKALGHETGKA
ncbi:MAG: Arc family DNA-binding protein [Elusimicrobia bacterium]|nr:Arc family DNA-binding protein [Elusimicrobiota bacterium]